MEVQSWVFNYYHRIESAAVAVSGFHSNHVRSSTSSDQEWCVQVEEEVGLSDLFVLIFCSGLLDDFRKHLLVMQRHAMTGAD